MGFGLVRFASLTKKMGPVLFFTLFIFPVALAHKFPAKFERCHLNETNLDDCLKTTIQNALRLIGSAGIASINLPSIDPIEASSVEIGAGTSAVRLVQKYKDVKVRGLTTGTVSSAHLDLENKELTFTILIPKLIQEAKYEVDGKIMVLPVFGSGDSVITMDNMKITSTINFEEETKKGKKYFKITQFRILMSIKNAHFEFENLFNGDKRLADNILHLLNENGPVLFEDVREGVQSAYAEIFKTIAARLFHHIPIDEIFLS